MTLYCQTTTVIDHHQPRRQVYQLVGCRQHCPALIVVITFAFCCPLFFSFLWKWTSIFEYILCHRWKIKINIIHKINHILAQTLTVSMVVHLHKPPNRLNYRNSLSKLLFFFLLASRIVLGSNNCDRDVKIAEQSGENGIKI